MTTDSQRNPRPPGLTAQSGESEEKALDLGALDYPATAVQTRSPVARVRTLLRRINI
jgi:DNA-binding response OmpR family regulator